MHKRQGKGKKEFARAEKQQDSHKGQGFLCCSLGTKMPLRRVEVH